MFSARVTPKLPLYRLEHPATQLCVRFYSVATPAGQPPRIQSRLTRRELSTGFFSRRQAEEAFARFIGPAELEIVRCES